MESRHPHADVDPQAGSRARAAGDGPVPFDLTRWFTLVASICIALVSAVSALVQSRFLKEHLLERDAAVSLAFVQSIAGTEKAAAYFSVPENGVPDRRLEEFFNHIAALPDVMRANVFARDGRVLWSSDAALVGRRFDGNPELERALAGEIAVASGDAHGDGAWKPEHIFFGWGRQQFVELYLPVRETASGPVVGVVELYRLPHALFATIRSGTLLIWASGIAGGALLFAALFWLVRRASRTIQVQQRRIVEAEALAVVGEMSTVVAHGIRNPLASIRSSAELITADLAPGGSARTALESARDITHEVDRLEGWVRGLLTYAQPARGPLEDVPLAEVVRSSLDGFAREFDRRGIVASVELPCTPPTIRGNRALLAEVLNNLVSNAIDAMPSGGTLRVVAEPPDGDHRVRVAIVDSGVGISPERLREVFAPFFTTKGRGIGLGLPLARRILRRCGGDIELESAPGRGTSVKLQLQAAR
jgi:signal transduction histidine kinase